MADGKLIFDTGLDQSGINSDVGTLKSTMTSAFKKIGAAIATYLAVDKVIQFGKACVESAAEVSAEISAFNQIMGGYADKATEKMTAVADATGVTASRLTPYMTSMTAKFKGLGFDIDDATTLAAEGLTLASDATAFWDLTLDDSMSALNSFINGSYEGGEAIGLFANDTQMAQYAVQQGLIASTSAWASLDEATKQATRLEYAQKMYEMSGATGQAAKEAEQYANVVGNLKEAWRQYTAAIGTPLLEALTPVIKNVTAALDDLTDSAPETAKSIGIVAKAAGNFAIGIINNTDKIVAAGKAVGTAFVLTKSIQGLSVFATKTQFAAGMIGILVDANDGAKIASTAMAKELTVLQLGLGVLTGKVKVATAAQLAYDAAMAALNPAALIAGIGVAVVSLSVFANSLIEESSEVQAAKKAVDELAESHENLSASFDTASEAIKTQLSDSMAEIGYLQNLKTELDSLVDANGKVKEGYEERVSFILNQLSEATGIEMSLQDGLVQGYGELGAAIDEYLEKKKAEAYASIANEALTTELKNQQEYLIAYQEYQQTRAEIQQQIDDVDMGHSLQQQQRAQARIAALKEELAAADEDWAAIAEKYEGGQQRIAWAEEVLAAATEGNFQRLEEAFFGVGGALEDMTNKSTEELSAQLDEVNYWLPLIKALYDQYGTEELKSYINQLEQKQAALEQALSDQKTEVETRTPEHSNTWRKLGYESYEAYCAAVRSGKADASKAGDEVATSGVGGARSKLPGFATAGADSSLNISTGILSKSGTVSGSAKSVTESAREAAASVNTTSVGSSFTSGIASGISSGLSKLKNAAISVVRNAYDAAKRWLDSHSPSKKTAKGLGVPWTQGVGVGIESETPKLMTTARESMRKAVAAAKAAINEAQISTSLAITPAIISSGGNSNTTNNTVQQAIYYNSNQASPSDVKRAARRGIKLGLAGDVK
mgnify:CR=1 FL=1